MGNTFSVLKRTELPNEKNEKPSAQHVPFGQITSVFHATVILNSIEQSGTSGGHNNESSSAAQDPKEPSSDTDSAVTADGFPNDVESIKPIEPKGTAESFAETTPTETLKVF